MLTSNVPSPSSLAYNSRQEYRNACFDARIQINGTSLHIPNFHIPNFLLNNVLLTRVTKYKYLGHCISDDLSDDDDMARQYRQIYAQGNALLRKFFMCTESVKITSKCSDHFVPVYIHANYGVNIGQNH